MNQTKLHSFHFLKSCLSLCLSLSHRYFSLISFFPCNACLPVIYQNDSFLPWSSFFPFKFFLSSHVFDIAFTFLRHLATIENKGQNSEQKIIAHKTLNDPLSLVLWSDETAIHNLKIHILFYVQCPGIMPRITFLDTTYTIMFVCFVALANLTTVDRETITSAIKELRHQQPLQNLRWAGSEQ